MKHNNRLFVPGGVAYVMGGLNNSFGCISEKMDILIRESNFLKNAPFSRIGPIYRYCDRHKYNPRILKIKKNSEYITSTLELDMKILQWADWHNAQLLEDIFMVGALNSVIKIGEKYNLPTALFKQELARLSPIPESIKECEEKHAAHPENHLITIYNWGLDRAQKDLMHIFNKTERHEWLKKCVHKIPRKIMEEIIAARLEKSSARKAECDELLAIMDARIA